jgi:hypothetical protein
MQGMCLPGNLKESPNSTPAKHEGKKYPCRMTTTKSHLTEHQRETNEGKKYSCRECDNQATSKGSLTQHQQTIHKGKKNPCSECDYQATTKCNLTKIFILYTWVGNTLVICVDIK